MAKRQTLVLLLILSFLIPISFTQKCDDTDCATDGSIDINKYMCFKLDDTTGCKWTLKCEEGKDSCSDLALNDTSKYNCVTKDPKNTQFRKCEVELKKCNEIPSSDNEIYCSYFPVSDDKAMTHGCIMTQNLDGKYFCREELLCDTIKKSNEIIDCSKYAVSDDFVFKCVEHNNSDVYA